jgi:hypothetical protein
LRAVEVELVLRALARELAQPAQRDLDVARAELDLVVVVTIGALLPDLHAGAVAARRAADAHALGVEAAVAERRGAVRADPLAAALVAFLLLLEQLAQPLHELVESAHRLDRGLLLGSELALELALEPLQRHVDVYARDVLDALEVRAEGLVELVEVALVLDEGGARQVVELVDRVRDHVLLERLEQGQVFLDRDRQLRLTQVEEEFDQHASLRWGRLGAALRAPAASPVGSRGGASPPAIPNR